MGGGEPRAKVHPFIRVIARALSEAASSRGPTSVGELANASFQGAGEQLSSGLGVRDRRHQSVLRYDEADAADQGPATKLGYASRILAGTALRMLIPRLKLLHEQLIVCRRGGGLDELLKRVRVEQLRYRTALSALLHAEEFRAPADEFRRLTGKVPEDLRLSSTHTEELVESYAAALQAVVAEFAQADRDFLDTLASYCSALVAERQLQKRAYLEAEQHQLGAQFEELMESLDGSKLHGERETLRRDLESAKAELATLGIGDGATARDSDEDEAGLKTLLRAFSFGKKSPAPERPAPRSREAGSRALLAKIGELEKRFKALERVKDKLIGNRDLLRGQLGEIEAALASTGDSDALQSAHEGVVQARVMAGMQERQRCFERLRAACAPVQVFRDARSVADAELQPGTDAVAQLVRSLDAVTSSSSLYQEIFELVQKLLAVYWGNPARALAVFQHEARSVRELTRPGSARISQPMEQWFDEMREQAEADEEPLRQFLATLRITAPEEVKRHVEAEFNFLYAPQRERGY